MYSNNNFWLIDPNAVGVIRFYKYKEHSEDSINIIIEEGIIMGMHGEKPPLMKTRKKIDIKKARLLWKKLLKEGWHKTYPRW